jgi:hypothetical protein
VIDLEKLKHFEGPIVSQDPTKKELRLISAGIKADREKQVRRVKSRTVSSLRKTAKKRLK